MGFKMDTVKFLLVIPFFLISVSALGHDADNYKPRTDCKFTLAQWAALDEAAKKKETYIPIREMFAVPVEGAKPPPPRRCIKPLTRAEFKAKLRSDEIDKRFKEDANFRASIKDADLSYSPSSFVFCLAYAGIAGLDGERSRLARLTKGYSSEYFSNARAQAEGIIIGWAMKEGDISRKNRAAIALNVFSSYCIGEQPNAVSVGYIDAREHIDKLFSKKKKNTAAK